MQWFIAGLIGAFADSLKSWVGRVLLALGISFASYAGFSSSLDWIGGQIRSSMMGLPSEIISFLAWLYVDKAISMIISAVTASLIVRGLSGGSITKMVTKK